MARICWRILGAEKRGAAVLAKAIPSRPRMKVDRDLASLVLSQKEVAARAAGYETQMSR